jgi:hypothetical protein
MIDIFVGHDWRESAAQQAALNLLDQVFGLNWRNFGTPWHDPAIDRFTPDGARELERLLDLQISPAKLVLLPMGLARASRRGTEWLMQAATCANRHAIPILGLMDAPGASPVPDIASAATTWIEPNADAVRAAITPILSGAPATA